MKSAVAEPAHANLKPHRSAEQIDAPPSAPLSSTPSALQLIMSYQSARVDLNETSYLTGHGGRLSAEYHHPPKKLKRAHLSLTGSLTYVATSAQQHLTPSAMKLSEQSRVEGEVSAESSNFTPSAPTSLLQRPAEATQALGWGHRASLGLGLSLSAPSGQWSATARGGVRWDDSSQDDVMNWACLRGHFGWLWISSAWRGDACLGLPDADVRAMLGVRLGRARLGGGWGVPYYDDHGVRVSEGGALGWVSVPLSAPLYLELGVWYSRQVWVDQALQREEQTVSGGRVFTVGLKWTGETSSPELEAPKPKSAPGASPQNPRQQLPTSPTSSPLSPSAPPSFSPQPSPLSPIRPSAPGPSPSPTPL